jgi:hypothetical protein
MNEIIESKKIWPRNTKLQIYRHAEMWDIFLKKHRKYLDETWYTWDEKDQQWMKGMNYFYFLY